MELHPSLMEPSPTPMKLCSFLTELCPYTPAEQCPSLMEPSFNPVELCLYLSEPSPTPAELNPSFRIEQRLTLAELLAKCNAWQSYVSPLILIVSKNISFRNFHLNVLEFISLMFDIDTF